MEDREIVDAAPLVPVAGAEENDLDADRPANGATTLLPGPILERAPISFSQILTLGPSPMLGKLAEEGGLGVVQNCLERVVESTPLADHKPAGSQEPRSRAHANLPAESCLA